MSGSRSLVSGSRCAVPVRADVAHEVLETAESMVCGEGDGKETSQSYHPSTGGPPALLTPEVSQ